MKVCVNSGHSNVDCGAVGLYSEEADICRDVGHTLCIELEAQGIDAVFVQEDELQDICDIANQSEADVFISIHCNAAENKAAEGTETFYWEYGDESYQLAELVQYELTKKLNTYDRGLKDGQWLYVLKHTDMACTILTELAFISNPKEEDLLNENLSEIAVALCDAIVRYGKEKGLI